MRLFSCPSAVLLAFAFALSGASAQAPVVSAVSKIDGTRFPIVTANVTLVDGSGRPVLGVGAENWELLEDGKPIKNVQIGTTVNAQEPLLVALAIDTSGSMAGRAMEDAKAAATTFVQGLGASDRAAVVAIADKASVVQPFTSKKDELTRAIAGLRAAGDTALYDALSLSAQIVSQEKQGRRIVVLLTDGEDTVSKVKMEEALVSLQSVGTPVFTVGLGSQVNRNNLASLAAGSGGVALYAPSSSDLQTAYSNIADQLRNQYVLTFNSALQADGQRHTFLARTKVGGAQTEATAAFTAISTPPEITIVAPTAGAVVRGKVRVEVQAKAAGQVKKVEATAAGRLIGSVEQAPYVLEWDTSQLAAGNVILDVTVYDSLGNHGTKQVAVSVDPAPVPTATPQPTATPKPTPAPVENGPGLDQMIAGGVGIFVGLGLVVLLVRRSRHPRASTAWQRIPKDKPLTECPNCGRPLKRGHDCPDCAAKDQEIIRQRLRDLGDKPGGSNGGGEGGR
ncbi:MAG: VWA domain-containing protein [Chloroflexota bacterium]